jgi:hypothetical protein
MWERKMDRHGGEDSQALARIVAMLLALAAVAAAAGASPARNHIVLLAVLRHAAYVACGLAAKIRAPCVHAQADRRFWPVSGGPEAVQLAEIFRALACVLAFPARQAIRAARWLVLQTSGLPGECPPTGPRFVPRARLAGKPCFADTS